MNTSSLSDPLSRLTSCIGKLQDQMERVAQMQAETTMLISRLSGTIIRLSQEIGDIKGRLSFVESSPPREDGLDNRHSVPIFENPSLTPTIDPASLISDPIDFLGPLVPKTTRILVVEDDVAYQWLVSKTLESRGVNCVVAQNAQEALSCLRNSRFDLILMDIGLPGGMSGLDTVRRIRTFDATTPIVSMTSSIAPRQIASYLAGGMNDVLPKPFSQEELLGLVGRFCGLNFSQGKGKGPIEEISIFSDDIMDGAGCSTSPTTLKKSTYVFAPHL